MSGNATSEPALSIKNLTVTLPNGRRLFDDADLEVGSGEFIVLAGPSGSGKTTLLRWIAGLLRPGDHGLTISGQISIAAGDEPSRRGARVGLVFQNLALFDELTAEENVQFALDHRPDGNADGDARAIVRRLGIPTPGNLDELSGGERQRVAVARTLAQNPPILLFDEPTTGLDPARARTVAKHITDTHRENHRTVIVVTHDYQPFLRYHPRLVLLDGVSGKLRTVDEAELGEHFQRDFPDPEEDQPDSVRAIAKSALSSAAWSWVEAPGEVLITLLGAVPAAVGGWRRPRWRLRYLRHYLRMAAVGTTAVYVALAGVMLGFVFIFFSFSQLPYKNVMVPLMTEEFLAATGYSMFRVIVPLLVCVLMAGKCGAAVAADVGARRLTHQFDAMRSFGVEPRHYLYGNAVLALVIGVPLLCAVGLAANWYASLVAYLVASDKATVAVFQRNFFATVWSPTSMFPAGTGWMVLKAATSGLVMAALAYTLGSRPKASSVDVSRDVGLTIFWSSLAVLLVHSLFSFVEF